MQLTKEQKDARLAFNRLLENSYLADQRYDSLPSSRAGRIISTDIARSLDTRYRDTPDGQSRDLVPGWDLAWRYAHDRLAREIQRRGHRKIIRFMAGGWGAGKTHALERELIPDLSWDGTLQHGKWNRAMIDLALSHGWKVQIAYVFRDMELALYGAVERAFKEGRSVPLAELPAVHRAVQKSVLQLIRRYPPGARMAILLLHNTGAKGVAGPARIFTPTELAAGGALHYPLRHEAYYTEIAREIEALNPCGQEVRRNA